MTRPPLRQSNGSEVGVDVLSACHVGGRASKSAPPEGPFEAAGGGERPGVVRRRQVSRANLTAEKASWPDKSESLRAKELRIRR